MSDLFCVKRTSTVSGQLEVNILGGSSNYQDFLYGVGTPITAADAANYVAFGLADYDGDGIPDLFCLKRTSTVSGQLEVNILGGSSNYQDFLYGVGTPITAADAANYVAFGLADYDGDGIPDLFCLKRTSTVSGQLEVNILGGSSNYQDFLYGVGTPITAADAANYVAFGLADYDGDGIPDLFCLKRTSTVSGQLEVNILGGSSNYQDFLYGVGTPITAADAANYVAFGLADYDGDGIPDLFCLKRTSTVSGQLEVNILGGSSNYQDFLYGVGTPITAADAANYVSFGMAWWDPTAPPPTVRLNFTMQLQTQNNWCWAAAATSVALYYNTTSTWTQCGVANGELARTDCCGAGGPPGACNVAHTLDTALTRVGHLNRFVSAAVTRDEIRTEIIAQRPLCVRTAWSGGGAHFVAITGYTISDLIEIDDPISGVSDVDYDVFTSSYQGSGTWTHSYFTN